MTETPKQQRIRRFYTQFSELCTEITSQNFEVWEDTLKDPPDIYVGDGDLGIEFVDFVHGWRKKSEGEKELEPKKEGGSIVKASEANFDRIAEKAQNQFEQKNPTKLWVSFFWQSHTCPKKSEIPTLTQAVVKLINKTLLMKTEQTFEIKWDDFAETCLADYLDSIHITAIPDMPSGHWHSPQAGWTRFGAESFQMLTNEKEKDLPRYSKDLKSFWLVIVADGSAISSTVIPDKTVKPGCIVSKFNRVYFFNVLSNRIILLTADEKL